MREKTPYNSTYPKGGFSCSKDIFVVNGTLVFQIKFCGKSPALRVAAKRCVSYLKPAAQTAHLVFADTKANAEKPKELFFANTLRDRII